MHSWDVGSLLGREARALTGLSSGFSQWSISAPDQALIDATDRSDTAGARLTLVGGEVATLLLAFVVLAANALRGDAVAERRRLERRGARRGQVWLFALAEGGWIALLGVLAGALAGIVIGVAVCNSAGLPAGAVMSHSLLTGQALLLGLAALVVSVLLVVVVLLLPDGPTRYGGVLADAVAVAGLAALALAAARGATSIGSTTDARSDPLLPLLPLLVALVAGVAVARLLGPAMRLLERRVRGASAAVRIAVVSVAREPLPAAIAAAFLAVALGLGFFATAYGQTLRTGQSDQADFAVPADVTLAEGPQLVRPLDAASLEQYQRLAGGTVAMPVLRLSATAAATGTRPVDITALALPAQDIPDLRWRSDTSNVSQATLARRLTPAGDVSMRGPLLDGSGLLRLAVDVTGSPVTTALVLQTDRQSFVSLPMGVARVGHSQLERRLPARLAGSRLVAISIDRTAADSKIAIHQQGEGGAVSGIKGSVLLGPLTLGAAPVTDWSGWIGRGGLVAGGPGAPVRFVITGATHPLLRPVQPSDGRPVPGDGEPRPGPRRRRRPGAPDVCRHQRAWAGGGRGTPLSDRIGQLRGGRRDAACDRAQRRRSGLCGAVGDVAASPQRRPGGRTQRPGHAAALRQHDAQLPRGHARDPAQRPALARHPAGAGGRRRAGAAALAGGAAAVGGRRGARRPGGAVRPGGAGRGAAHAAQPAAAARRDRDRRGAGGGRGDRSGAVDGHGRPGAGDRVGHGSGSAAGAAPGVAGGAGRAGRLPAAVGAGGGAVDQGRVLGRPAAAGHGGGAVSRAIDVRDVFRIHRTAEGDAAALQGLTLSVEEGEIVVVLGPSGAGKSTLLRILAALEPLSAGIANVYGLDIGSLRGRAAADYRARRLGMIDQHYTRALPPDLRCEEIIGLQLALRGEQRSQRRDRAAELLAAVGLERAATMLPGQLSGGEQQRVAVCAALAHRPQLLLADEPSGELDRRNGDIVYELIRELVRGQGTTAVIVSHDHGATRIADRIVRIRDGRLSEEWRDGRAMLVVGHGGWVHLPEHLRAGLGITSHVQADQEGDGVVLRPAPARSCPSEQPAPPPAVTAGSEPVAALRQVTKAFGTRSLFAGYDAEFRRGAMTAVIGRSGSGKSTMLAMLAGLERPDSGEVLVLGQPLSRLDRDGLAGLRRSSVAYVGQEPGLVAFLSAEENVTFTLGLRGVTGAAAVDRARESLSQVGLAAQRPAGQPALGRRAPAGGDRPRAGRGRRPAAGGRADVPARPGQRRVGGRAAGRRGGRARSLAVVCATHDPLLIECAGVRDAPGRRAVGGRGIRARRGRRRGLMWRRLRAGGPLMSVPFTGSPWHVPG